MSIVMAAFLLKINDITINNQEFLKEMEFNNTTFTEVDTNSMIGHAYSTYGVRKEGVLFLENLVYYTNTVKSLVANKAKYKGNTLYLDGNVVFLDNDGYTYKTEHAIYNQKTTILNVIAPFTGTRGSNIIKGDSLLYNTRIKKAYGTAIDSVLILGN